MRGERWLLSPIDSRYKRYTAPLRPYLSEAAFFRYRLYVEIAYFEALLDLPLPPLSSFPPSWRETLWEAYHTFDEAALSRLEALESQTQHDVKAIEYYLRETWQKRLPPSLHPALAYIHFGLTSQDINNTALPLMWRNALEKVYLPKVETLLNALHKLAYRYRELPMLSFTHGQPASPTTLGKELYVFVLRARTELKQLQAIPYWAKLGGAVGNLNAHQLAFPEIDWIAFFDQFAQKLGLVRFAVTTQILPYERWAERWDSLHRLQSIFLDLCQDLWLYAHRGYLNIRRKEGQIGSSTMPHKVNPIAFELAEGNFRLSNALWQLMSEKLPISRLQRDLTDSTVLRNLGVALAHGLIGVSALQEGLTRMQVQEAQITADLQAHPEVLAEATQTLRRKANDLEAYEKTLRELTAGEWHPTILPESYLGYASRLVPPPEN